MGGGLMQLVAYGAQDIYLTGNPQITFFKVVYRRHTNFSMEAIEQTFNGSVGFGNRVTATVSRNGDLVHRMWLQATLAASGTYHVNGNALVDNVELEVGGQRVDKQYGDWMEAWSQLSTSEEHRSGLNSMLGKNQSGSAVNLYLPLQFWFCRNPGLALPLIALQYHEVKVNLTFVSAMKDSNNGAVTMSAASLWVDYIYLDTDERRRFAQVSHEYLIEQVQFTGDESVSDGTNNIRLNFNHPVKELVWVFTKTGQPISYADYYFQPAGTEDMKLQLNGHDRFAARPAKYFTHVQPYQHHTAIPAGLNVAAGGVASIESTIHVYSFALKPEEHQPSGTCNFSRIDNATLSVSGTANTNACKVFAVNYNVLRVMSGMGGLAYSN